MKSAFLVITGFSLSLLTSSCDKKKAICTEELRSITVSVLDVSNQAPVNLDSTITRGANANIIQKQHYTGGPFAAMTYVVLDDSYHKHLDGLIETIRFYGYKDGRTVVDTPFVVSADNCHIYKVQGPNQIKLP